MRTRRTVPILLAATLVGLTLSASNAQAGTVDLQLGFTNLAPLSSGHYEGWLLVGGAPVSTGKFQVAASGGILDLSGNPKSSFRVSGIDLSQAARFVLTIEPEGDADALPAAVKPLAGDLGVDKRSATLAANLGTGVSLSGIGGRYILATPSNGEGDDELSGVWFLDRSSGTPRAGLQLPSLEGSDWVYEGWVVFGSTPLSTGRFDSVEGADDRATYYTGSAPPFPGEDFLESAPAGLAFPRSLAGAKVAISIEPRMDDDPGPFQFKPLVGDVPTAPQDRIEYPLSDKTDTLSRGTVTITEVRDPPVARSTPFAAEPLALFVMGAVAIFSFRRLTAK